MRKSTDIYECHGTDCYKRPQQRRSTGAMGHRPASIQKSATDLIPAEVLKERHRRESSAATNRTWSACTGNRTKKHAARSHSYRLVHARKTHKDGEGAATALTMHNYSLYNQRSDTSSDYSLLSVTKRDRSPVLTPGYTEDRSHRRMPNARIGLSHAIYEVKLSINVTLPHLAVWTLPSSKQPDSAFLARRAYSSTCYVSSRAGLAQ